MTDTDTAAVRTEGVWKVFHQEAEEVQAVRDVSLTVGRGEFTALAGPSGSGKTTLLNLIGGLTRPSEGRVEVAGRDVTAMSNRDLSQLRLDQVGFVFQAYNLLPVLTAMENAEFPMLLQGVAADERRARVHELFERTGHDRARGPPAGGSSRGGSSSGWRWCGRSRAGPPWCWPTSPPRTSTRPRAPPSSTSWPT